MTRELPGDVLQLDEAYPGMALADQVRAYVEKEVSAELDRCVREIEQAAEEYASAGVPFSGACRSLARRIARASVTAASQSPPADPPAA